MLYDISPSLTTGMPVWPGDTPFQSHPHWVLEAGCPVNVARLTLSPHSGAHADAPSHYLANGMPIGAVALQPYLGVCRVVHCLLPGLQISLAMLQAVLADTGPLPPRILLRTYERFPHERWDADFPGIDPAAIDWLASQGVLLIGVDTASLDPSHSKSLAAHHAVARHGMAILENLVLDTVAPGDYELIALPLKLMHSDASPVRAILRDLPVCVPNDLFSPA